MEFGQEAALEKTAERFCLYHHVSRFSIWLQREMGDGYYAHYCHTIPDSGLNTLTGLEWNLTPSNIIESKQQTILSSEEIDLKENSPPSKHFTILTLSRLKSVKGFIRSDLSPRIVDSLKEDEKKSLLEATNVAAELFFCILFDLPKWGLTSAPSTPLPDIQTSLNAVLERFEQWRKKPQCIHHLSSCFFVY
jgi:hypothetical protein